MLQINDGTILWVLAAVILLFSNLNKGFYALVFSSALTTIAFVNIGDNSILISHIAFLICAVKFLVSGRVRTMRLSVGKGLSAFIVWCFLSLFFPAFHRETIVYSMDEILTHVRFTYQEITQYSYLLIGFLTCLIGNALLIEKKIKLDTIGKVLETAYVVSLSLALLQHILPLEFVNAFYRNTININYAHVGARISGTFNEPSMLSLYCAPLFAGYLYRLFSEGRIRYFLLSVFFLVVTLDNESSSGILGIVVAVFLSLILILFAKKVRLTRKRFFMPIIVLVVVGIATVLNISQITSAIESLLHKLNAEGASGASRMYMFLYHIRIGISNIIPTGFGTVRSFDLLSTWFCSIGLTGLLLYIVPVVGLSVRLLKAGTREAHVLFLNILIHNLLMFVSVPEYSFLSIWFYYAMAYYLVNKLRYPEPDKYKILYQQEV